MSQRFKIRADVDDLWQTVQPGPFNEKQPQWLTLQLCLVTVGVTEWIECSRPPLLNKRQAKTDPRVSPRPPSGAKREDKTRQDDDDDDEVLC